MNSDNHLQRQAELNDTPANLSSRKLWDLLSQDCLNSEHINRIEQELAKRNQLDRQKKWTAPH
jgi:hypothetical protein